ncbi:MAG TPA: hypothetical protein IAC91_11305 [Candidatus Faecimorpha stercoravium]|nr:hypothetical protein [Candidatus Faecimorpha stercoravium]
MKRCLLSIIVVLCLLCGAACQTENHLLDEKFDTEEFLPDYDVPMEYAASNGKLTRYQDVYYAGMGNIAVYYDTVSGVTGAVCGKADCAHDSMACNAYLDFGNISGIQIYDGKLYWLQGAGYSRILYRMDLDGNNREQVQILDDLQGLDPRFAIHRGHIYTTVLKSEVQDRQPYTVLEIKEYVLGQKEQEPHVIYNGKYTGDTRYYCRFYGTHMYVAVDTDETLESTSYDRQFFSYDMATQEWKLLWEDTLQWSTRAYIVDETGADILELQYIGGTTIQRVRLDFETGTRTVLGEEYALGDQSASMIEGYVVIYTFYKPEPVESHPCLILDWDTFEVVAEHEIEGAYVYCYGGDEDGLVFQQDGFERPSENEEMEIYKILQVPYEQDQEPHYLMQYDALYTIGTSTWESIFK